MKLRFKTLAPLVLATALLGRDARAWEPATTHAGLTEQSALSSHLHSGLLQQFGASRGLYTMLTVPEADAPALFEILRRLNPIHGYTPDTRGKMSALAWLVAGAVVADVPIANAANHFFDPRTGTGLTNATADGLTRSLRRKIMQIGAGARLTAGGQPATTWLMSEDNAMGYPGFSDQFRKAASAATQGERDRHLAGSLLAAGAMLHVLQDMGSPSHVRDDIAAHQQRVGTARRDRGSRFERVAALAFGRLGIPAGTATPGLTGLTAHLSSGEGTGLADITERRYFSAGTLPRTTEVKRDAGSSVFRRKVTANLRRPEPAPPARLDSIAARNAKGATWTNEDDVCLARYRWRQGKLSFVIDDSCALEQLEVILPTVAAYGISFLETLYPNDLTVLSKAGKLLVQGDASRYGQGTLRIFADSVDGVRSEYHSVESAAGVAILGQVPKPPRGSTALTVLFDGENTAGQPLLSTTTTVWPLPKRK